MRVVKFVNVGALVVLVMWPMSLWSAETYETLGRLFFTPAQREKLDLLRRAGNLGTLDQPEVPNSSKLLRMDGELRNSQGTGMVWINGQEMPLQGSAPNGQSGQSGQRKLRIGETIHKDTGQRYDIVPQGQIVAPGNARDTRNAP